MILYQVEDGIARVSLNRPEKRNALDAAAIGELRRALADSAADPGVRVVLVTGAGSDFCSGMDLSGVERILDQGPQAQMDDARTLAELFLAMRHHPKPVVAAVRGRALAGGCGLATAADLVLASDNATFGYPEVNIGFVPAMVMAILRRSVPEKRAFELIAMGTVLSASEALAMGLINRVSPAESFDADVNSYVAQLAAKASAAVALSKQLLYHMDAMSFEAALESGVQMNAIARSTADFRHGLNRFLKKV